MTRRHLDHALDRHLEAPPPNPEHDAGFRPPHSRGSFLDRHDRRPTLEADPMPPGLPARVLKAIRHLRRHTCGVEGCTRDAVVFPPPMCEDHGGLEVKL